MSSEEETPNTQPSTSDEQAGCSSTPMEPSMPEGSDCDAGALDAVERKNPASTSNQYIRLRVITMDMSHEARFRIKSTTALGRLKRSYCAKLCFQVDELRFMFNGHRITDDETARRLGMINDDIIEVHQERSGGGM